MSSPRRCEKMERHGGVKDTVGIEEYKNEKTENYNSDEGEWKKT